MLFSHRTFIPVAYWYVSKHLPRLFYRNFNKIQFCSFYNIKIIDRLQTLVCPYNIVLPFFIIIRLLYLSYSLLKDRRAVINVSIQYF